MRVDCSLDCSFCKKEPQSYRSSSIRHPLFHSPPPLPLFLLTPQRSLSGIWHQEVNSIVDVACVCVCMCDCECVRRALVRLRECVRWITVLENKGGICVRVRRRAERRQQLIAHYKAGLTPCGSSVHTHLHSGAFHTRLIYELTVALNVSEQQLSVKSLLQSGHRWHQKLLQNSF